MTTLLHFLKHMALKFKCAFKGLKTALLRDSSLRNHLVIALAVIGFSIYQNITNRDWIIIIFCIAIVIVSELFNTAIELLVQMFTQEHHELAEKLLDTSAAAVLIASIAAAAVGIMVFLPYLLD